MGTVDIEAIVARLYKLEEENSRLKTLLSKHGISYEESKQEPIPVVSKSENKDSAMQRLSLQEKVKLFRELFKGREDVFAKRWYSDVSKKSGYQPVCEREWNSEFCDKRKYKCTECPNRLFASLTDEHIYNHLAGKDNFGRDVVGVYPIMSDNTCNFLCTDFDDKSCKHGFQNDVLAFVGICKEWEIPCYIERSRSGNGAHVWIFFKTPITATKARKLGKTILSEAMNKDARLSFNSYDRFFPNQDTLPEGGFGNLVALPLQGKARRDGNSVFVNEVFQPSTDQWDFLLKVQKIDETRIIDIIQKHNSSIGELTKSSETRPWETPKPTTIEKTDFPSKVTIIRANMLYIPLVGLSAKAINHFKRISAFYNPEFYAKQGMRLSTYDIPRIISCSELMDGYLAIPRGCEDDVIDVLKHYNVEYLVEDKTNHGRQLDVIFKGTLRKEQQTAMYCMLSHNIGTLSATTAFGKTVFAIAMIAERKVNTLILVHRKSLLDQWKNHLENFIEINEVVVNDGKKRKSKKQQSPIGTLYSGKNSIHGIIDIALIQSCFDRNEVSAFVENYGMVIVDECHHVSSVSFEQVLRKVKAKYVYGLTATPIRKDGHQPIIFMQCGKIRFTADAQSQMNNQSFCRILIPRFTTYRNISSDDKTYTQIVETISKDDARNRLIIDDVHKAIVEGRTPIVLTSLTSHVRVLADMLLPYADNVITLVGADSTKEKRCAMERLQNIRGLDTPTVLVVVYGNRAYEKALMELDAFALPRGLKVIAGATFIGEHSYSTDEHPIAAGRPNDSDLALATEFGKKIIEKIKTATGPDTLYPIDVRAIKRPRQPFFPLFRFLRKVIKLRKSGTPLPRTPWVKDESLCTHCGLCVVHCPAGAITKGDELNVDETKCIKCCACVKVCPRNAKVYDTPFAALLSDCFKKQKQPQTIL